MERDAADAVERTEVSAIEDRVRRSIAQGLHDDVQQHLYSLRLQVDLAVERLRNGGSVDDAVDALTQVGQRTDDVVEVVRNIARGLCWTLDGIDDVSDGLAALADHMAELHDLKVEVHADRALPPVGAELTETLVQVTRELLFNVAKHAGTGRAAVDVQNDGEILVLRVTDHGAGFTVDLDHSGSGLGLDFLRRRVRHLGGDLELETRPGRGTVATVRIPTP